MSSVVLLYVVTGSAEGSKRSGNFSFTSDEKFYPSWGDRSLHVHFGIGCDFCGVRFDFFRVLFIGLSK